MNALPSPPTEPLLEIRNLTIRYREGARKVTAVRDVSFAIEPRGSLAIVGESGSGKSSVAGAILNFLGPEAEISGTILFEGQDIIGLAPTQRRQMLGSVCSGRRMARNLREVLEPSGSGEPGDDETAWLSVPVRRVCGNGARCPRYDSSGENLPLVE